jgi:hypothetical protein
MDKHTFYTSIPHQKGGEGEGGGGTTYIYNLVETPVSAILFPHFLFCFEKKDKDK